MFQIVNAIKNSKDVNKYRSNIISGKTSRPDKSLGKLEVDMESLGSTFHLGEMTLQYETKCSGANCTTTYTVDDKGFVDPNSILFLRDDNKGPKNELGGTPYDYEQIKWSETYKNPGYSISKDGSPQPINKNEKK